VSLDSSAVLEAVPWSPNSDESDCHVPITYSLAMGESFRKMILNNKKAEDKELVERDTVQA